MREMIIFFLQVTVSIIYLTNKVILIAGKKVAWLVGTLAALLAIVYYQMLGLHIYTVLNVGMVILMVYGYFKKGAKNPRIEMAIRLCTVAVMCVFLFFTFAGTVTVVELVSSLTILFGTFALTHGMEAFGWALYVVGHSTGTYIGYFKKQIIFADLQIASAVIAAVGVWLCWEIVQKKKVQRAQVA